MPTRTSDLDDLVEPRSEERRYGAPVDPGRLWLSLKRDWRWIPLAAVSWAALGVAVALVFMRPSYKAESVLMWQPASQERAADRQLATQAGTVKLPGELRKVKQRLKLGIPIKVLDKQIEVWFDTRSNLVTINASGPNAHDAAMLTNTVVAVFLDEQHDIARAHASEAAGALEKDLAATQAQLAKTHQAYDDFRAANGVADIAHESRLAIDNAAHLREQLQQARAASSALEARAAGLGSETRKQQRTSVQSSTSVNPDAAKLAELRAELAAAHARYSPEHPRIAMLEAQVAALAAHASKSGSVVSGFSTAANPEYQSLQATLSSTRVDQEAVAKQLKSYEQFVQIADERVATLTSLQGKAHSFEDEVARLEKRITDLQSQLSEAHDAARSPPIEWHVLTPAIEPEWPEQSKRRVIATSMPIAGMLVALLALLLRPLLDGRVCTAREAAYWARVPVLASTAWPRNREMFFSLVDELGDSGASAHGYTLLLGATGREKPLAEELAYWLGGHPMANRRGPEPNGVVTPAPAPNPGASVPGVTTRLDGSPPVNSRTTEPEVVEAQEVVAASGNAASRSVAMVAVQRQGTALGPYPAEGTHAWLGAAEGPALRRAVRSADRVIVLLTSGAEIFTAVAGLRVRIGRDDAIGIVLLGLDPELLKLPDRVGDVDGFWRTAQSRRG